MSADEAPDPRRWKALAVCLVAGFMTLLDVSIVNVALPSIQEGLDAREGALQWIVSGYALTLGLLLVPSGRLGDARGQRPLFMTGVALFVLASAGCGLAPSETVLIVMRLLQGFAGGLITPQVSATIQNLFRGEERGKAFGFFGTTVAISTAIGPLLGGLLIELFGDEHGWRAVFFVNLPIGIAALVLAHRYLPAPPPREDRDVHLDPLGVILLGAAVVCLLLPFIESRTWDASVRLPLFPLAAVLLGAWVLHERRYGRTREPLVSLDLFAIRSYVLGAGVGMLYFAGFTARVLHPHAVPADRARLLRVRGRRGGDAVRDRLGADRVARQPSRADPRAQARRVRAGDRDRRLRRRLARRPGRARDGHRALDRRPALPGRPRRRARHLAEPDALALARTGAARRQRGRRAPDRPADRLGGRDRGDRQRLLQRDRRYRATSRMRSGTV